VREGIKFIGGDPAKPRAVALTLDRVQIAEPDVTLTRTEKGLVLPQLGAEPDATAPAQPKSPPADMPPAAPALRAKLTKFRIERGRVHLADRSVKPFYDGRIEQLDVIAGNLAWPPLKVDPLVADLKGLHGMVLHVHGGINPPPGVTRIRAELDSLPLAPFNPYVAQSGFSLANGSLALELVFHQQGEGYDAWSAWLINLGQLPYTSNAEFPYYSSNYPPLWSYVVSIPMAWLGPGLASARLISIISHDLVTPLRFLHLTGKNLIERKHELTEELQQEVIGEMATTSKELELLSTNILNWIKYRNEDRRLAKESFNLHELVTQLFGIFQAMARQKEVQLLNTVDEQLTLYQFIEPVKIVLYNLILNGINFTPEGLGFIRVSCTRRGDGMALLIEDTGVGMTQEQINNIMADHFIISSANVDRRKVSVSGDHPDPVHANPQHLRHDLRHHGV